MQPSADSTNNDNAPKYLSDSEKNQQVNLLFQYMEDGKEEEFNNLLLEINKDCRLFAKHLEFEMAEHMANPEVFTMDDVKASCRQFRRESISNLFGSVSRKIQEYKQKDEESGSSIGKLLGAGLGAMALGPIGLAAGALIGHLFDSDDSNSESDKNITSADDQFELATEYRCNGINHGVNKDLKKAGYWYKKSANQGHDEAQYCLAELYADGKGFPQDYEKAAYWYRQAANQDHASAYARLGELYEKGLGVQQDFSMAEKSYMMAVTLAHNDSTAVTRVAHINLNNMFRNGKCSLFNPDYFDYIYKESQPVGNKASLTDEFDCHGFEMLMAKVCNIVAKDLGDTIRNESRDWINDKRNNYSGIDYIDQLERNVIYAREFSKNLMSAFTTFVVSECEIDTDFAVWHMQNGRNVAMMSVHEHLAYLRGESEISSSARLRASIKGDKEVSGSDSYEALKHLRASGRMDEYVDELEFWHTYYYAFDSVTSRFIGIFIQDHNAFDRFGYIPEEVVKHEAMKYIKLCINSCIENIVLPRSQGHLAKLLFDLSRI